MFISGKTPSRNFPQKVFVGKVSSWRRFASFVRVLLIAYYCHFHWYKSITCTVSSAYEAELLGTHAIRVRKSSIVEFVSGKRRGDKHCHIWITLYWKCHNKLLIFMYRKKGKFDIGDTEKFLRNPMEKKTSIFFSVCQV